ncbi:hypothetical protein F0U60_24295 [Archangium minus]|uniref:Uncharacterized protein n=1 Tax=Archangium minus TaxID=83450 RepID=A0ABY9WT09_9BACT|nr:hypothetical protein F0U60_24295 [Archangium minus]
MSISTEQGTGGERPSRWPRRRVLRWALGLAPVVAGGGWAASEWLGGREVVGTGGDTWSERDQEAAWFCFAGHPDASFKVELRFSSPTPNPRARLLRACLSMQEGRWDSARRALAFPEVRNTPEARLLLELAERRPSAPDWRHAFFEAWQALGRPDFRKSLLLPAPLALNYLLADIGAVWGSADEIRRFSLAVLHLVWAEPRQEWMLEQVRASSSVPLLMALREQLIALEEQAPVRQFLLSEVEARLGQLAGSSPRTLQLALVSFLAGKPLTAPFERRDLEELETLVALPDWKQPASEPFFLEMRALFDGLMPTPAHHAFLLASSAQAASLGSWLIQRARASKAHLSEDEQRWMGRLLWEVGARLYEQRSAVEMDMGLRLQVFGSELTQHVPTRERCIAAWVELGRWEDGLKQAGFYRWPLLSLQEESCESRIRDERAWMKAFAGTGELP